MTRWFWRNWDYSYLRGAGSALSRLADEEHSDEWTWLIDEQVYKILQAVEKWDRKRVRPPTYESCVCDEPKVEIDGLEPSTLMASQQVPPAQSCSNHQVH